MQINLTKIFYFWSLQYVNNYTSYCITQSDKSFYLYLRNVQELICQDIVFFLYQAIAAQAEKKNSTGIVRFRYSLLWSQLCVARRRLRQLRAGAMQRHYCTPKNHNPDVYIALNQLLHFQNALYSSSNANRRKNVGDSNVKDKSTHFNTKKRLTIVGRQVLSLNRICRCSDSLSKIWSLGPLFKEHSRQRSVNAVKLRSSGSVMAKHLMRRSRRQELSMYTAVVLGWRETGSTPRHVAGAGTGRRRAAAASGGHWGPARASRRPSRPSATPRAAPRHTPRARSPPATRPDGWPRKTPVFPLNAVSECCLSICN